MLWKGFIVKLFFHSTISAQFFMTFFLFSHTTLYSFVKLCPSSWTVSKVDSICSCPTAVMWSCHTFILIRTGTFCVFAPGQLVRHFASPNPKACLQLCTLQWFVPYFSSLHCKRKVHSRIRQIGHLLACLCVCVLCNLYFFLFFSTYFGTFSYFFGAYLSKQCRLTKLTVYALFVEWLANLLASLVSNWLNWPNKCLQLY